MPTKCDECGEESYCIFLTIEYKRLCGDCYDKVRPKDELKADDKKNSGGSWYRHD